MHFSQSRHRELAFWTKITLQKTDGYPSVSKTQKQTLILLCLYLLSRMSQFKSVSNDY